MFPDLACASTNAKIWSKVGAVWILSIEKYYHGRFGHLFSAPHTCWMQLGLYDTQPARFYQSTFLPVKNSEIKYHIVHETVLLRLLREKLVGCVWIVVAHHQVHCWHWQLKLDLIYHFGQLMVRYLIALCNNCCAQLIKETCPYNTLINHQWIDIAWLWVPCQGVVGV